MIKELVLMVALGDSITTGFNTKDAGDNRDYSWSTGSEIESHAFFLKDYYDVEILNVARAGSRTVDLERQIKLIPLDRAPEYITLMSGNNNLCSFDGTNYNEILSGIVGDLIGALNLIEETFPNAKVMVSSLANFESLYANMSGHRRCFLSWSFACNALTNDNRTELFALGRDANNLLRNLTSGYDQVRFDEEFFRSDFKKDLIAVDCFHPNVDGQEVISLKTFQTLGDFYDIE